MVSRRIIVGNISEIARYKHKTDMVSDSTKIGLTRDDVDRIKNLRKNTNRIVYEDSDCVLEFGIGYTYLHAGEDAEIIGIGQDITIRGKLDGIK